MSYHIYTTEGIVLKKVNYNEADALFYILTSDLGLIVASAQAVRSEKSKLRSSLLDFTLLSLSCVKGKGGWKITNAISEKNFFFDLPETSRDFLAKISKVLVRMMQGEEKNREVFETVKSSFESLTRLNVKGTITKSSEGIIRKNIETKNLYELEVLAVFRVLYYLGYIQKNPETKNFLLSPNDWSEKILKEVSLIKLDLISLINKGLTESHL